LACYSSEYPTSCAVKKENIIIKTVKQQCIEVINEFHNCLKREGLGLLYTEMGHHFSEKIWYLKTNILLKCGWSLNFASYFFSMINRDLLAEMDPL
jgi:hypothetical protein